MLAVLMLCAVPSCTKTWNTAIELGVNSTRINLSNQIEGDFVIPVYSNRDWSASVSSGAEWLSVSNANGSGRGFFDVHYATNEDDDARIGKVRIVAGEKEITVNIVQSGMVREASAVSDLEL